MTCQIRDLGSMCGDCGRLIMRQSVCPVTGERATPPTQEEIAQAEAIAAARATARSMLGALVGGSWPTGDVVNSVERVTLKQFNGEYVEGMEPVEVVEFKLVNGRLESTEG